MGPCLHEKPIMSTEAGTACVLKLPYSAAMALCREHIVSEHGIAINSSNSAGARGMLSHRVVRQAQLISDAHVLQAHKGSNGMAVQVRGP